MEIEIVGSGGAIPTPRPGCHCRVCDESRAKGVPYARGGPATFIHGANILFDTPEEIRDQLNRSHIDRVDACFYSHWHPDHVMGRRIFESLNYDLGSWPPKNGVTDVYLPQQVPEDFEKAMGTAEHLAFLEQLGVNRVHRLQDADSVTFSDITVTPFRLAERYVYAFLVESPGIRVLIAPDELHGWEPPIELQGLDLAVLSMGICVHDPFTGERRIPEHHSVLTEEMDGLSFDDLDRLATMLHEQGLPVRFAHDTMRIDVQPR